MTFLAFGNHTVRNLLCSPYFSFKKILLREEQQKDKELLQLLEKNQIPYQLLNKDQEFSTALAEALQYATDLV